MQEASGSDLKFIIEYVKQRRGMSGVRMLLNKLNTPSILFTGLGNIGRTQIYPEEIYKKVTAERKFQAATVCTTFNGRYSNCTEILQEVHKVIAPLRELPSLVFGCREHDGQVPSRGEETAFAANNHD